MGGVSGDTDLIKGAAETETGDDKAVAVENREGLIREISGSIQRNPNVFGAADIFNLDYLSPRERAAILITSLMGIADQDRRPAVRGYVVITPPGRLDVTVEAIWAAIVDIFPTLAGWALEDQHEAFFKSRISVVAAKDLSATSVLEIIANQPEQAAVIVTEAAAFRSDGVEPFVPPGGETPLMPEDVWAPHVHSLAAAAMTVARERIIYVAIDANRMSPRREALNDLLQSIEGCGVIGSDRTNDPETILAARIDEWDSWVRQGRLGPVLQEIDALPSNFDSNRKFLRIQMMFKAGLANEALQLVRDELQSGRRIDPTSRVKLARIAHDAHADRLAAEILAPAAELLDNLEDLESAMETASRIGKDELEERFAQRLQALFPTLPALRQRHIRSLLAKRDYAAAADALAKAEPKDPMTERFYRALASAFTSPDIPDYHALVDSAGEDRVLADAYRMASVRNALDRKLPLHALDLALPLPHSASEANHGILLLIETLEMLLLGRDAKGQLPVRNEQIEGAVLALAVELGKDTGRQRARVGLVQLLQPSLSGFGGQALIASIVLQLAERPVRRQQAPSVKRAGISWLVERKAFLKGAFGWMKSEEPVVIGRSIIPPHLVTEPADDVVSAIGDYFLIAPPGGKDDDAITLRWLALGSAIAPHCSEPNQDLMLLRLAATRLASSGRSQAARDLAEQALINANGSPARRRLGWFAMADVYSRLNNHIEALVAMAAALAADDSAEETDLWHQITTIARIFRNLRLFEQARAACGTARRLLAEMGLEDKNGYRVDTLELQIRHVEWLSFNGSKVELEELLRAVVENGAANLAHNDMAAPVAVMLGQLLVKAEALGASIPDEAADIFKELRERSGAAVQPMLDVVSTDQPSADDLLEMVMASDKSRYSDDAGYDARNIAVAAGRVLANPQYANDAVATSFALELLADWGVAMPGWDNAAEPAVPPASIGEPAEIAKRVSLDGVSVVQAGFDSHGRLVRVTTSGGNVEDPVLEREELILEERLRHWSRTYPFDYGIDVDTPNLFYTTTQDLRFSALPEGPTLLVADTALQVFPPNLLYNGEEFAGRQQPIAATPSLSWLEAALDKGPVGDGRHCAWISSAEAQGQTLQMITGRLEETFETHHFEFDTGTALPGNFSGATMAVIAAHGGIHPDGRYFQLVSDEGALRVSTSDMANALRNIDVVILFVCSGGRTDVHPAANTTIGLAKQILDRGCTAVIGSPWPLDSRVPAHWLPPFLDHWASGANAMTANFEANKIVDKAFGLDPASGLAMSVFGNPLVRKP